MAAAIGVTVGRDTLLQLVRALPEPPTGVVEVLGVDDFAFRKGRHYGTVLIDMTSHRPLHLFDGREGEDLAAWLRQHPEVKVICRDRSGGYGEGARVGAPRAKQVADRFHLWHNLGQAVEKTVNGRRSCLAASTPASSPAEVETEPALVQPPRELKIVTRMRQQHAAVHELWEKGPSKAAIGRKLGLHQATVRKLVNARTVDEVIAKTLQRAHVVDPYTGYLHSRWNEGTETPPSSTERSRSSAIPAVSWPFSSICAATAPGADTHPLRTRSGPQAPVGPGGHLLDHDQP